MSLVPEPQVNLPQFHMINPDNCVLIASELDGIQFSGPRFLNKQLSSHRRGELEGVMLSAFTGFTKGGR